jgi:pantoate kinase
MRAAAFCPGHITGFFEICERKDLLSTGSRGAGLCLTLGATSSVVLKDANRQSVRVKINDKEARAEVTKSAVRHLIGKQKVAAQVTTTLDLPQCQGFGMSAAGALSASIAVAKMIGREKHDAYEAAHIAEVENKSGLGDVSALHGGGMTIRQRPGLPPIGRVLRIRGEPEVVLSVMGGPLLTRSVLTNPAKRRAINASGAKKVDEIVRKPTVDELFRLSSEFALETGLASRRIIEAMSAASKLGMASMSMLGNSVFAIGDTTGLKRVLSDFGEVWVCKVDVKGPRII